MKTAPEIYLLCRCIERKYAEKLFDDGILHFSYPKKWIDEARKGNVGQGDFLEGVYSNEVNLKNLFLRKCPRVVRDKNGEWYLRSNSVVKNWPCVCFYCASELSPHTYVTGSTLNLHPEPMKDSVAIIHRNEEKDTFHYLRDKVGYVVPSFEKLLKWNPDGMMRNQTVLCMRVMSIQHWCQLFVFIQ